MRTFLCFLACALIAPVSVANDAPSHHEYAKPLDRRAPRYPNSELANGRQGWVDVNFVITEEGKVVEPVVEASSGSRAFERAAMSTVEKWLFKPALRDGEPIQQCKTAVRISFALEGEEMGVSQHFHRSYRKIEKALEDGDVDTADTKLERAFKANGLTLGELSWLWALQARLSEVQGDKEQELIATRRALAVSEGWVPSELRAVLLRSRFFLEIEHGNYASAMTAYTALKAIDDADTSKLDPIADRIEALVDSDQLLVSAAQIGGDAGCQTCESRWRHEPLRRAIEIADVKGQLGELELRCEWQRYVDQAREGVAWEIPADWGDCTIIVHGETGSTFKLVELPPT